jgi:putative transposase
LQYKIAKASLQRNGRKDQLYRYITGIIQQNGQKLLQINGMPDHIHLLFGLRPIQSLSDFMKQVKQDSSKWTNLNKLVIGKFSWQEGYGAFSYSKSQVPRITHYIQDQQEHHKKQSFSEEYLSLLRIHDIDYDERFLFKPIDS